MRDRTRRAVLSGTATVSTLALAGCLGGGGDSGEETSDVPEDTEVVRVGPGGDYVFEPEELTVDTGTTVRFVWGSSTHNVAVTSQPESADWQGHETIENEGFSFEYTFDVAGRYEYVCTPHRAQGMQGAIVVEE